MVEAEKMRMEGYLWKWTNYVNGYQKRWFILESSELSYYRSSEETNRVCRGKIKLSEAFIECIDAYTFSVINKFGIAFYIKCSTEIERQRWITSLEISKAQFFNSELSREKNKEFTELFSCLEHKLKDLSTNLQISKDKLINSDFENKNNSNKNSQDFLETSNNFIKIASDYYSLAKLISERLNKEDIDHSYRDYRSEYFSDTSELVSNNKNSFDFENNAQMKETDIDDEFQDAISDSETVSIDLPPPVLKQTLKVETDSKDTLSSNKYRIKINPKPDVKMSLWGVVKNCIGKDLSKIPMPVNFNEPLSMLQRVTESLEYSYLLEKAATCQDSLIQMCYVAAFSVASYANTSVRTGKPFNPLLGETYENDRMSDLGFQCLCEQVSHHPPISALHANGKNWTLFETFCASSKFRGKYLTVNPLGTSHVEFPDSKNHYTWNKVTTTVHNIIVGKLWIDQSGSSTIVNHVKGDKCILKFSAYSYLSSEQPRKVVGTVTDKNGNIKYHIQGYWDQQLSYYQNITKKSTSDDQITLWRCSPLDPYGDKTYFFSPFACSLNQIDKSVAPTDSRNRPDQRKMEDGYYDLANEIKLKLEDKQREKKKENEILCRPHQPKWFKLCKEPYSDDPNKTIFLYSGNYWECKTKQNWSNCPEIFKY